MLVNPSASSRARSCSLILVQSGTPARKHHGSAQYGRVGVAALAVSPRPLRAFWPIQLIVYALGSLLYERMRAMPPSSASRSRASLSLSASPPTSTSNSCNARHVESPIYTITASSLKAASTSPGTIISLILTRRIIPRRTASHESPLSSVPLAQTSLACSAADAARSTARSRCPPFPPRTPRQPMFSSNDSPRHAYRDLRCSPRCPQRVAAEPAKQLGHGPRCLRPRRVGAFSRRAHRAGLGSRGRGPWLSRQDPSTNS